MKDKLTTQAYWENYYKHSNPKRSDIIKVCSVYDAYWDMFMGKVPVFFETMSKENVFVAESLLANCSEEQMVWRLWITVELESKAKTFFVDFTSKRI